MMSAFLFQTCSNREFSSSDHQIAFISTCCVLHTCVFCCEPTTKQLTSIYCLEKGTFKGTYPSTPVSTLCKSTWMCANRRSGSRTHCQSCKHGCKLLTCFITFFSFLCLLQATQGWGITLFVFSAPLVLWRYISGVKLSTVCCQQLRYALCLIFWRSSTWWSHPLCHCPCT